MQREDLDAQIRRTLLRESVWMQRVFVSHGTFDDVRRRQGNPSAVAFTRLQQLRNGKRRPLNEKWYGLCRWCGNGVPHGWPHCVVCKY